MTYECHITVDARNAEAATAIAKRLGWKTSQIDGDPLLGDKVFFYLTKHARAFQTILHDMLETGTILEAAGIALIRQKIELIVFDTKTGEGVPT
jgi:hypothetical protein